MDTTTTTKCKCKTIKDILGPKFTLSTEDTDHNEPHIPNRVLWFKTKKINTGVTTLKEIYKYCKKDLQNFQEEYNHGNVNGTPALVVYYSLEIIGDYDEEKDDLIREKIYFLCKRNGNTEQEIKYFERENLTIQAPFNVYILISLYTFPSLNLESQETSFYIFPLRKSIKEEECVICKDATPNVLYQDCKHIATCSECENAGRFSRCSICRTAVRKGKIQI